jgi:hypothetical protein
MEIKTAFISQYTASLAMLKETISKADDNLWLSKKYKNPFWQIAYHALFFSDLYLSEDVEKYTRWEKHKEGYNRLGKDPENNLEPYTKDELIEFLNKILGSLKDRIEKTDLTAPAGFHWLKFNKLELQIYNIRHIQHHTGQLTARLRNEANVGISWVSDGNEKGNI